MKLLLVEDEKRMADALTEILRLEGYEVTVCCDGISGDQEAVQGAYDILILDVMLPGMSGLEIAKHVRNAGRAVPILMLTAKADLDDKVKGLDCGADDYLTKPFETRELLARLRALARRAAGQKQAGESLVDGESGRADSQRDTADVRMSFGDLELDTASCMLSCTKNGHAVRLGGKEFRIMEYFLANTGHILTREQLAQKIWGYDSEAEYNNVEVYLTFTRRKLNFIGSAVEIKAVRNLGYEMKVRTPKKM